MIDRQKKNLKSYCSEPLELVENYQQAKADNFAGWCIHHRLEIQADGTRVSLQELKDHGLYYGRPASELVFMRRGEHMSLHSTGNKFLLGYHHSEKTRLKMSESLSGENHPLFGKHHSEESRKKMSASHKGKHFSAETRLKLSELRRGENHPLFGKHRTEETRQKLSEARKGMHWWNNGIEMKMSRECPGTEWKRGMI